MTDWQDRRQLMQRLNLRVPLDPYYSRNDRHTDAFMSTGLVCMGFVMGMIFLGAVKSCVKDPEPVMAKQRECIECHNTALQKHSRMTEYFKKAGSKSPEEMAYAVLKTRSPRLLSAIAKVESGGNHGIRRTGFKKLHDGAFQVNPKYWGAVPRDAVGQALQAEAILSELTQEMPIKKALSVYGGDTSKQQKYANAILRELQDVPK